MRMRDELVAEDLARKRATAWLAGWSCGAAFAPIPEQYLQDPDFAAGWHAGREAKNVARAEAEAKYGYTFATVRLQSAAPQENPGNG